MLQCANPAAQFYSYQDEIEASVLGVIRGGRYILGDEVCALEAEFSKYIGVSNCVGVANGTDALQLAMMALDLKVGDEVVTVSHTAVATVAAIESLGLTPVLVDVDPNFYTLNCSQLEEVVTPKTRAVIAVHLYGQAADLEDLKLFCNTRNLFLIEDVSQAHGAKWNGERLGSFGDIACFSCYPTKNLGAIGDAGLIVTNDDSLASKARMFREYGWKDRYISSVPGRNSRLDEMQAAILRIKLKYLDKDNFRRYALAALYDEELKNLDLIIPARRKNSDHVFHLYVMRTKKQKELVEFLLGKQINIGIHYPLPIHMQPAYKGRLRTAASMKITEMLAQEVISLPMYPELELVQVKKVVSCLKEFLKK